MASPLDEPEFRRWREDAGQALAGARVQHEAGIASWACFQSEQAAQLAIKALLHALGLGPWGHDLDKLRRRLEEGGLPVPDEVTSAGRRLGRFYIPARYADAHAEDSAARHYDAGDSAQALADAGLVLRWVDDAWDGL